ncbi:uncharacterized protein LOC114361503 [Ostrinia furnacalis]|uniref:uncharacterized protein LOC114361503 n=1 Tax=Ostrinia furnacalis TaxID=93504 RepID=UPI00103AF662|nr:uncharacterized protein LOC114361503 [Ostrinia furnacalis]
MASKPETDFPPSPTNNESDGEAGSVGSNYQEDDDEQGLDEEQETEEQEKKPSVKPQNNNVADILKRLQSSGALIKKPKQEYRCNTCDEDFPDWEELENHLIQHVSLPSVVLDKLPSDDEDYPPSGDENWSDEDDIPVPPKPGTKTTPQKIDISQILKKTGLSLKKPAETESKNSNALNKLSGLGFTIKKNNVQVKKEPESEPANTSNDVMKKLGQLGGIKLKLKSDGNNSNSFKVINGLRDFKASDEEDNDESKEDQEDDEELEKSGEQEGSGAEHDSAEEDNSNNRNKNSDSDDSDKSPINQKISNALKNLKAKNAASVVKQEPLKNLVKQTVKELPQSKPVGRPAVKQTPKRGANLPIASKEITQETVPAKPTPIAVPPTIDRRQSRETTAAMENIVVKKEVDSGEPQSSSTIPLFSGQVKTERASPPIETVSTPIIARIKSDPDAQTVVPVSSTTTPLLPVTKQEDAIIEINGDSNDEDDDCCVVSATPAPDIKPIVPKIEEVSYPSQSYPAPTPTSQPNYGASNILNSRLSSSTPSTEKQHNFNWNAPDTKPPINMLDKSADDIFESLLSTSTKKENLSLSDASEYISLDTLGPQQTCEVCNTRFTDLSLLEEHRRMTGHSKSVVLPSSSNLLPYSSQPTNLLSSLLPVKQLAEQVGKLSTIGGGAPGFTHQQNVMINIQAYPGGGGMVPPQPYNAYAPSQNMHPGYPQASGNMYGATTGQSMPGQYPGQHYMGQQYGQFQTPMSKTSPYPSPQSTYSTASSPYSTTSPLQSMQQAYGQNAPMMNNQVPMGQMGPPGSAPSQYTPASSPGGTMKPPTSSGVRIQNVQTFQPGQMVMPGQTVASGPEMGSQAPGQMMGGQMPAPSQIRMATGANVGQRPRMPGVRNTRPSIRPGIQVHGQVRGQKPGMRMPMKRPGGMVGGPGQKRRPDMLLPGKHDNEDCQVMAMQKQREGLPLIHSVQGAKEKLNLGSQISITKKTVNKEANAMANVLASRGISIKQKQKSRSPTPERPIPHIPNLGSGVSIKHTSKSSSFSIPEAKIGGGVGNSCKYCKKMFMNQSSLQVHMAAAHPQSKVPMFKCDECPASYPKSLQLQHHKRVFHNVTGPNRELGLPVVDLSQEDNLKRLSALGIYSFIPLANREQANGCFGIPVISVHHMQNGMTSGLQALGADGLLSLGPLKPLPNT